MSSRRPSGLLHRVDFGLMTPASRVVEEILALEPNEHVAIVHDGANEQVAFALEFAATSRGALVTRMAVEEVGERPLRTCPSAVSGAARASDATILAVDERDGEFPFRQGFVAAAQSARARHVHMVGVSHRSFAASLMGSLARVFDLSAALRRAITPTSRLSVRSSAGTRIEIEMAPHLRWFENGGVVRRGDWVNVPCGALVTSPGKVNGVLVVDASMSGVEGIRAGLLTTKPITLEIADGRVRKVSCVDQSLARVVEGFARSGHGHDRVGLLNLGVNIGIVTPLGELSHDETMPGVHLSLGHTFAEQTGAFWSAPQQLAFASVNGDVDLDGVPLVRRGRYVRLV